MDLNELATAIDGYYAAPEAILVLYRFLLWHRKLEVINLERRNEQLVKELTIATQMAFGIVDKLEGD